MDKKVYICECGKEFDNSQSFNGHKSHCLVHQQIKGTVDLHKILQSKAAGAGAAKNQALAAAKKLAWIEAKHRCERCGKIMTERFGSGRYCSRVCANSRPMTAERSAKISESLLAFNQTIKGQNIRAALGARQSAESQEQYAAAPKFCKICGKLLTYENRFNKVCSDACRSALFSENIKTTRSHLGLFNVCSKHHHGNYKGFHYDSSWELAYIVYNLEHNIQFTRNFDSFSYKYNNIEHKYFPDFIQNGTYIEIKNYYTTQVQAKIDGFPKDRQLKILYKADIQPMLDYCKAKYGSKFWETLN